MTARPPLTRRERRGAAIAGIAGFLLATIGWVPFVLVGLGYIFAFGVYFLGSLLGGEDSQESANTDTGKVAADLIGIPIASLGLIISIACVVGVLLIAAGILVSIVILKRHSVNRAAGVTWLGLLLAIVGSWILDSILAVVIYAVAAAGDVGKGPVGPSGGLTVIYLLIALAVQVLLGWLGWWWMAHALRRRPPPTDQSEPPQLIPGS
jgi:hypothetical protein